MKVYGQVKGKRHGCGQPVYVPQEDESVEHVVCSACKHARPVREFAKVGGGLYKTCIQCRQTGAVWSMRERRKR